MHSGRGHHRQRRFDDDLDKVQASGNVNRGSQHSSSQNTDPETTDTNNSHTENTNPDSKSTDTNTRDHRNGNNEKIQADSVQGNPKENGENTQKENKPDSNTPNTPNTSTHAPTPDTASTDFLRHQSRRNYLQKRHDAKLEQLAAEIKELESSPLSPYQQRQLQHKKEVLQLAQNHHTNTAEVENLYSLPAQTTNLKRKHELLTSRTEPEKKSRYDSQWELDQMRKAQAVATDDKIDIADSKEYEFVFDDSQLVDFTDSEDENPESSPESPESPTSDSLQDVRRSLPVYKLKDDFLSAIAANQVMIVVGETGSGKTTQLPQYLHEAGYSKGPDDSSLIIGCTQPRRVAATSVAARVAQEMGVKLGNEVGYSIRFEDETSPSTVVKYLTDGMLLREFLTDPLLLRYGALMIDEAHERTVSTEIILSLLKDIIKARPEMKLIVASATINAQKFADFFDGAPIFNIPGRRFPVDIHYTKNPEANYIQAAITTIFQIHTSQETNGDILVFLTGQDEIESMEEALVEACQKLGNLIQPLIIAPIYANLPPHLQQKIFEQTPPGSRKVVLATNIAETSITINGIKYVIDPGYVKENVFNPVTGMESLVVVPCSKASADQRAGRAGRVGPGKCFRLYTKWSFHNELQANPTPEILRVNLTSVVLMLLSLGINDLIGFDFMDPPSSDTLIKSLELLYALGALNSKGELTKMGRTMAEFPIDPMFSKCLITASEYGVSSEILSIIALLSESSSLFYRPKDKKEQADKKKEGFRHDSGDHLSLLNLWQQWVDTDYSSVWCQDNFVQYKTLKRARDIRDQLEKLCKKNGIVEKVSDDVDTTLQVQKAITSGFFPNIARLSKMGDSFRSLKKNQPVFIHPSSSLYPVKPPPKLVLYHELVLTSKEYMRNCMLVDDSWLAELAPHYYSTKELDLGKKKLR